jgi:TolB-like protein
MGAGNHSHTWDRRIENQLAKIVFALRDKIGEARGRCRRTEARVKVCAFKVSVNSDHAVARAR